MFSRSAQAKNVETITSKLHDTVRELEQHADEQMAKAEDQRARAYAAQVAHDAHRAEHGRAKIVAGNIKGLLGA